MSAIVDYGGPYCCIILEMERVQFFLLNPEGMGF